MQRFIYYFIWTIVIGVLIYWGLKYKYHLEKQAEMYFEMYPTLIFTVVFPFIVGLLFRLPLFIIEVKENREWTFDWQKFSAVALPALFIIVIFLSMYAGINYFANFTLIDRTLFVTLAGVVFGYTLLDCLKK